MTQHPQVVPCVTKEAHFFDWNWGKRFRTNNSNAAQEAAVTFFAGGHRAAPTQPDTTTTTIATAAATATATTTATACGAQRKKRRTHGLHELCSLFACDRLVTDSQAVCLEVSPLPPSQAAAVCFLALSLLVVNFLCTHSRSSLLRLWRSFLREYSHSLYSLTHSLTHSLHSLTHSRMLCCFVARPGHAELRAG